MNFDNPLVTEMLNSLSAKLINKQKETEKWGYGVKEIYLLVE